MCTIKERVHSHQDAQEMSRSRKLLGTYQASFRLDERPVLSVHLMIEPTRVAKVVSCAIASPERCRGGPTVNALAALG